MQDRKKAPTEAPFFLPEFGWEAHVARLSALLTILNGPIFSARIVHGCAVSIGPAIRQPRCVAPPPDPFSA
jgi:hypothetical protein